MATLDRLRDIVRNHRSSVPVVAPSAGAFEDRGGGPLDAPAPAFSEPADYTRAALELGGALVEHADGAVIVVDRDYGAGMLHGRTPIGEIVSTINDGDDALQLMGKAWPSASGVVEAGLQTRLLFLDLETTGLFTGAGTQAFAIADAALSRWLE